MKTKNLNRLKIINQQRGAIMKFISLTIGICLFSFSATAATPISLPKTLSVESGKVEFLAVGKPSFLKVNGIGSAPSGTMTIDNGKASGEFSFDLASLDTKNETRNEHMKEKYLEVGKFQNATIKFKDVLVTDPPTKAVINAELTLHGVAKPVAMTAELNGFDKKNAAANFKFKLSEYGIEIPKYAGITIADEVTVSIEAVLK